MNADTSEIKADWLSSLKKAVEKRPVVVIRFGEDEWQALCSSKHGTAEFTFAKPHGLLNGISPLSLCLLVGRDDNKQNLFMGVLGSRGGVTTLDTRIKVRKAAQIAPSSEDDLIKLISEKPHATNFKTRLNSPDSIIHLTPKLSSLLIEKLAAFPSNQSTLRAIEASISAPQTFRTIKGVQLDALSTALGAFGLTINDPATSVELTDKRESVLDQISLREDTVVEHDARHMPGYKLVHSDITGRAVFRRAGEQLEVYTANRGNLEEAFGVDLIYLNQTKNNIIMLQYKMLNPYDGEWGRDWKYIPDKKLKDQIKKMQKFSKTHLPGPHEYRINPETFYLKFVKRDGAIRHGGIILPIDHYLKYIESPKSKGPRGGIRLTYESLDGQFLHQSPFMDLLRSGYIGSFSAQTQDFTTIIDAVLRDKKAVVAVIHSHQDSTAGTESDQNQVFVDDRGNDENSFC